MLDNARAVVAECLGVRPDEVTFTPSGTHAVHLGVLGLLAGRARQGDLLLASSVEHSAVLHAGAVARRPRRPLRDGAVDAHGGSPPAASPTAATAHGEPAVVAMQSANPEVGVLQPVDEVAEAVDAPAVRRRLRLRRPAPAARRLGGGSRLGAQVGRSGRGRRAAGAPGGALAQPLPRRRAGRRAGHRVRERPGRPGRGSGLRASLEEQRERSRAEHASLDRDARRGGRGDPGHRGLPGPGRPAAARGGVLVPLRRRRGPGHRARPARVRGRQRLGLHRQHPGAQPRARRDGRADPRQRAGLPRPGHRPRPRSHRLAEVLPGRGRAAADTSREWPGEP